MHRLRSGFSLVELVVVIMILGILAALVVPAFSDAGRNARQSAFVTDIKTFARAAHYYKAKTEEFLEDIPKAGEDVIKTAKTLETGSFKPFMPEAIIYLSLFPVPQDFIGLGSFFESLLSFPVTLVAIGMIFHRELSISFF